MTGKNPKLEVSGLSNNLIGWLSLTSKMEGQKCHGFQRTIPPACAIFHSSRRLAIVHQLFRGWFQVSSLRMRRFDTKRTIFASHRF
jgi:hypothetical protein